MSKIAVVALDLNKDNNDFAKFAELSGAEQIQYVKNRIQALCEELQKKEPDAMWVITWREYGITEKGFKDNQYQSRSISNQLKKEFKEAMLSLTTTYPNLTILAGTVSTQRHFKDSSRLTKIKNAYQQYEHIKKEEEEIQLHEDQVNQLKKKENDAGFDVLRNTSYFFQGNTILRHDKTMPYDETSKRHNINYPNAIFQPAKGRNKSTILHIEHEKLGGTAVTFGVEICREHNFMALGTELKNSKQSNPLIQFVLSDSANLEPGAMCGENVIQLDSKKKPRLIYNQTVQSPVEVVLYQNNLLKENTDLTGPLAPLVLFEKRILREFDNIIAKFPTNNDKRKLLELLKDEFIVSANGISASAMYKFLKSSLTNQKNLDILLKDEMNLFSTQPNFFSPLPDSEKPPDLKPWLESLIKMVDEESKKNPSLKDYISDKDSPLAEDNEKQEENKATLYR